MTLRMGVVVGDKSRNVLWITKLSACMIVSESDNTQVY